MRELLDDLLDYNRTSLHLGIRISPQPVDLSAVCEKEVELLRAALPSSTIAFTTNGPALGRWDASRLRQVVSNLVTNAAKYGDPAGTIRVALENAGTGVELSVENVGPSIPKELLNSLRTASPACRGQCASRT